MVGIYRSIAFVYHLVHLGPRYPSTSCQVTLSLLISFNEHGPLGLVSSAGLFHWTRTSIWIWTWTWNGLVPELCCLSSKTSPQADFLAHQATLYTSPSLPKTRDARRVEISLAPPQAWEGRPVPRLHQYLPSMRHCLRTLGADGLRVFCGSGSGRAEVALLARRLAAPLPRYLTCLRRVVVLFAVDVESERWANAASEASGGKWYRPLKRTALLCGGCRYRLSARVFGSRCVGEWSCHCTSLSAHARSCTQ